MATFIRNTNNNNTLPDKDIDTVVERTLRHIITTGSVEPELQNAVVRQYNSSANLGQFTTSDNSSNPPDLLIGYYKNELMSIQHRYTDNVVPSWRVTYDLYIKLKSSFNTREKDTQKAKIIVKLLEQYCTNNILSYSYTNYRYRTDINGNIYGTDLNSNTRERNSMDNKFYSDSRNTNFIQTAMSIKFKISKFNSI